MSQLESYFKKMFEGNDDFFEEFLSKVTNKINNIGQEKLNEILNNNETDMFEKFNIIQELILEDFKEEEEIYEYSNTEDEKLFLECSSTGNLEKIKDLIQKGVNINICDENFFYIFYLIKKHLYIYQ